MLATDPSGRLLLVVVAAAAVVCVVEVATAAVVCVVEVAAAAVVCVVGGGYPRFGRATTPQQALELKQVPAG